MLEKNNTGPEEVNLFNKEITSYLDVLYSVFTNETNSLIYELANEIKSCWIEKKNIFICGNGGSGANAIHMANDFLYGVGINSKGLKKKSGLKVEALSANNAVITCLANDIGYEFIFSEQIKIKGEKDDLLIVLSGSGNSQNIVKAIEIANKNELKTAAILGFDGGKCKRIAQKPIHFKVNNMRIAEDIQMIICNILVEWLNKNNFEKI